METYHTHVFNAWMREKKTIIAGNRSIPERSDTSKNIKE